MGEERWGSDGGWWRALARVEAEVALNRERIHAHVAEGAARDLLLEGRVTRLETRLALYAALGGALAGFVAAIIVALLTGSP